MRRKIGVLYMLTKAQVEASDITDEDVYGMLEDQIREHAERQGYVLSEPITRVCEEFPYPHTSRPDQAKPGEPCIEWRAYTVATLPDIDEDQL